VVPANPPEAIVWIRVPVVPAAPESTTVYGYFGNALATDASDFTSTFTKDYGEPGLAGLWHLDEGSGFTVADASGNGNLGVLNNMPPAGAWLAQDGGHWSTRTTVGFATGSALHFDGRDDFVDCGFGSSLSVLDAMTIEAWVRPSQGTVTGAEQAAVSKWQLREDSDSSAWAAHDSGLDSGFFGAAFDGRYVYFVPHEHLEGSPPTLTKHSTVVRYDTYGRFDDQNYWSSYDPELVGLGADGYAGAVFDGQYVYFVPDDDGAPHCEVLRYDTSLPFNDAGSWASYDPSATGNPNAQGYRGAVFDGQYIYFVPFVNGLGMHSIVLRYDTTDSFTSPTAWTDYDPGAGSDGYTGGVFDGRYVYFVPLENSTGYHAHVLRYDTTGAGFTAAASWASFDPITPLPLNPPWHGGFSGAAYDGRYIYFAPYRYSATNYHGEVLRYDTTLAFADLGSWTNFDPGAAGLDTQGFDPDGYSGAVFDGRYVHFVPRRNGAMASREVLVYDTMGGFSDLGSWAINDPGDNVTGPTSFGYQGAVSDGKFIYFIPYMRTPIPTVDEPHGRVLRYDTLKNGASYKLAFSQPGMGGSFSGAPFGISGAINTDLGFYSISDDTTLAGGVWHHLGLTYDGTQLVLYVDGMRRRERPASGFIFSSTAPLKIGAVHNGRAMFFGDLDEARVYDRALSEEEIVAHYERRKFTGPGLEPVGTRVGGKEGP
jgi:hypothetical protein